nr:glutathione reductase, cytosolic [Tanacetum cinerariifolium]
WTTGTDLFVTAEMDNWNKFICNSGGIIKWKNVLDGRIPEPLVILRFRDVSILLVPKKTMSYHISFWISLVKGRVKSFGIISFYGEDRIFEETYEVRVLKVIIDQDSDLDTTVVEITYRNRRGALLLDTEKTLTKLIVSAETDKVLGASIGFDDEMRALVARNLEGRGIILHPQTNLTQLVKTDDGIKVTTDHGEELMADLFLLYDGRRRHSRSLLSALRRIKFLVHQCGPDAAEIMQGIAVALKCGATKAQFDSTVGIHPSSAEEFVTMRSVTRRIAAADYFGSQSANRLWVEGNKRIRD